jgi:MFS family permease
LSAPSPTRTVLALGTTQTLAWASSYYLPAILAEPLAAQLGVSRAWVFGAFSGALLLSAALSPLVGRVVDARGGRDVLALSNVLFALGLTLLAGARGPVALALAWAVLGVGMATGLYDVAFSTLAALLGERAGGPIRGVTLMAGFASTLGWPLTALLTSAWGWRGACLAWAGLHLTLGLPLHRLLVPAVRPRPAEAPVADAAVRPATSALTLVRLAYVFSAVWFVSTALSAHLPRLLQATGASLAVAVAAGALVGPAQVLARLAELGLLRGRLHPLHSARAAVLLHPLGAALLVFVGAPAAVFALLHGAGNGLLTITMGTLPLVLFGPVGYGARQGLITAPARAAQATSPLLFGLLLDRLGTGALAVSAGLLLSAFGVLSSLRRPQPRAESPALLPALGPAPR